MKGPLFALASNLCSLACIIGAIVLAMNDKGIWGWFLIAGVALATSVTWAERN
jgi:hypothetical protein